MHGSLPVIDYRDGYVTSPIGCCQSRARAVATVCNRFVQSCSRVVDRLLPLMTFCKTVDHAVEGTEGPLTTCHIPLGLNCLFQKPVLQVRYPQPNQHIHNN